MEPGRDPADLSCRFELIKAAEGYRVRFHIGDGFVEERPFGFNLASNSRVLKVIGNIERGTCTRSDLQDIGSQLWNALRPPGIQEPFGELAQRADESHPLAVWLDIPPEQEIESLPWEALHDERSSSFLTTDLRYCVLRSPPKDCPPAVLPPSREGPIRVLVVIPEGSGLQVQYEWNNVRLMARNLGEAVEVKLVEGRIPPDRLQEYLDDGPWDVLHYIGHGAIGEEGVTIRLNHEDPQMGDFWMDAPTFASLLQGKGLRLALLNCCLGAGPSKSPTLSGLGPHLMRTARIPAVVAMRYEISDDVSIRFADILYRELFSGDVPGHIETAVQVARQNLRINATGGISIRGFITPILYLSPHCEQLFEVRARPAEPAPGRVRAAPSLALPDELVKSLQQGRCIPVVGPAMHHTDSMLRRATSGTHQPAPALAQLIHRLATESQYPEEEELLRTETVGDWLLPLLFARVCQHFQRDGQRYRLIEALQAVCAHTEPPLPLQQLARWDVPGIIYLHFDGLMEEALKRARKLPRVLNRMDVSQPGEHSTPLLVNVLGSLTSASSLALTEAEYERLWERLPRASSDVQDLVHQIGRSLLFLGVSPRDMLGRRLTSLLEVGEASMQGPCFFVTQHATEVDQCYWKSFNVCWIREDPAAVIEALTQQSGAGGLSSP